MPLTRFPNGLTVNSTTALQYNSSAGDGDIDCNRLFANGNIIGQVVAIPIPFLVSSAAQVFSVAAPFTGDLIGAYVTIGSVSAVAAAYTVRIGSAGTVLVSSESNTITTSYAQEALTIDSAGVTTAAGLQITRGVQGTAGDTTLTLLFKRTA
jgi:hypothetical protein